MSKTQSAGRDRNAAIPPGKPDAATPESAVKRVGLQSRKKAGPDGPDAREAGDIFRRPAMTPGAGP